MNAMYYKEVTRYLSLLCFCILSVTSWSQDKIITYSGSTIECVVKKISTTHVEYLDSEENGRKIEKALVKEVIFNKQARDPIDFSEDHPKAISVNLTSMLNNALQLSYEHALDASSSLEYKVRIYGVSLRQYDDYKRGGALQIGYRYRIGSLISSENRDNTHLLDGVGVKPIVGLSYANIKANGGDEYYYYGYFGTELDAQLIWSDRFLLDAYVGLAIFKGSGEISFPNTPTLTSVLDFKDGDFIGNNNVAYIYGLKFGYLFGSLDRSEKLLRW